MYAKILFIVHGYDSNFLSVNLVKLHILSKSNQWNNQSKITILLRNEDNKGFKPI